MKPSAGQARYTLFGTSACHLCELAEEMLLDQRQRNPQFAYEKVDISTSETLFERYGVTIPVVRDNSGRELHWPFTMEQLHDFVA